MQNYVHRADGTRRTHETSRHPKVNLSFDDLKQDTPDPDGKLSPNLQAGRRARMAMKIVADPDRGQPFYATDLGTSSGALTVGTSGDDALGQDAPRPEREELYQGIGDRSLNPDGNYSNSYRNVGGDDVYAPEIQDVEVGGETTQTHDEAGPVPASFPSDLNMKGFTDKYVPGDSLPDTTSGRLSVADGTEVNDQAQIPKHPGHGQNNGQGTAGQQQHDLRQPPGQSRDRAIIPRNLVTETNSHARESEIELQRREGGGIYSNNPAMLKQAGPNKARGTLTHEGFQFAPNPRVTSPANQLPPRTQAMVNSRNWINPAQQRIHHPPQQFDDSYLPQREQLSVQVPSAVNPDQQRARAGRRAVNDIQEIRNAVKRGAAPAIVAHVNQQIEQTADDQNDRPRGPSTNIEPDDNIDDQLLHMDYETLRAQSFDLHTEKRDAQTDFTNEGQSLPTKLNAVSKLPVEGQSRFFNSLSTEEWEETGDWFVDKFAGLVGKMKAARQKQRKSAEQFMKEIDGRHQVVARKRKQTDDAMMEMKASGAKVLQNTPKGRKSRGEGNGSRDP